MVLLPVRTVPKYLVSSSIIFGTWFNLAVSYPLIDLARDLQRQRDCLSLNSFVRQNRKMQIKKKSFVADMRKMWIFLFSQAIGPAAGERTAERDESALVVF